MLPDRKECDYGERLMHPKEHLVRGSTEEGDGEKQLEAQGGSTLDAVRDTQRRKTAVELTCGKLTISPHRFSATRSEKDVRVASVVAAWKARSGKAIAPAERWMALIACRETPQMSARKLR